MYCEQLLQALEQGGFQEQLSAIYGTDRLAAARDRAIWAVRALLEEFHPQQDAALFSGPGRTEIGGNHTDHQHGRVLCGSVDMDMLACAAPNGSDLIRIRSQGYPEIGRAHV